MRNRQVQIRGQSRLRLGICEHGREAANAALVIAQSHGRRGMQHPVVAILRIQRQQLFQLDDGIGVLVSIQHDAGVVAAQFDVIRGHLQRRGQQYLGIIQYVARDADACQQPHGLHMITLAHQKVANQLLSGVEFALAEQAGRRDDLRRHRLELGHVPAGRRAGALSSPSMR